MWFISFLFGKWFWFEPKCGFNHFNDVFFFFFKQIAFSYYFEMVDMRVTSSKVYSSNEDYFCWYLRFIFLIILAALCIPGFLPYHVLECSAASMRKHRYSTDREWCNISFYLGLNETDNGHSYWDTSYSVNVIQ